MILGNRACGICGIADIPRGVDWEYWKDGKPVHRVCKRTPEQQARGMLERMGVDGAESMSAGDLVELTSLIARVHELEREVDARHSVTGDGGYPKSDVIFAGSTLHKFDYHGATWNGKPVGGIPFYEGCKWKFDNRVNFKGQPG